MFIVLHCGGIPFNGETIRTKSLGGSESAAYYLAKELANRGHKVTLFTRSQDEGKWDGVQYLYAGEPSAEYPLGDRFHFYATNTPHDVLIAQRHPLSFQHRFASKINLLWLHDIALVRNMGAVNSTMWQVDGVLTVSAFHKKQVCKAWDLRKSIVMPITNGVDPELYTGNLAERPECFNEHEDKFRLIYQSRPERGLENLVMPSGIMERLLDRLPNAHLFVCGYSHDVPEMQSAYDAMYQRIEELPNCTNMGHLPKSQLAAVQQCADLLVYPTEFEEVSCITAMEAMHAGLPMMTSKWAALPETCKGSGTILIKHKNGKANIQRFVDEIVALDGSPNRYEDLHFKQLAAAKNKVWTRTADQVESIIRSIFDKVQSNPATVARDLLYRSDVIAFDRYVELHRSDDPIFSKCMEERKLYEFADTDEAYDEHYQAGTDAFYDGDFQKVGRERVTGSARFECVAGSISDLPAGSTVIDYGCAHGHYTIELARRNPEIRFIGIDISERAIAEAQKWAEDDAIDNIEFRVGTAAAIAEERRVDGGEYEAALADAIIAAEVLEHVRDPRKLINELRALAKVDALFVVTTPYGPWEQMSYQKDHPTRFHLHHFEREDLHDLFGHFSGFDIKACPSGTNPGGEVIGQYVTTFRPDSESWDVGTIDYDRKLAQVYPRQTVSLCMIAKDAEQTLGKALRSIGGYVDEVVVAIDEGTNDKTWNVIDRFAEEMHFWPIVRTMKIDSPVKTGFDEARNASMADAIGDWILWFDADEEVVEPQEIVKLLRNNQHLGYPLPQVHFSINPTQVLNTDYPVRLFRNHAGISFYGVVHEHPETKLNKGIGPAMIQHNPTFSHNGYITERIRRERFARNYPLMQRDREKYPERILGKFLWIRDVSHDCQFHLEQYGMIPFELRDLAHEAIKLWEELLKTDQYRMIQESMMYYDLLCQVMGSDLKFGIRMGASRMNGGINLANEPETNCHFASTEHIHKFVNKMIDGRVQGYETKYY